MNEQKWNELPEGVIVPEGGNSQDVYIVEGWRTFKPVVNLEKCTHCMTCWVMCPDNAVNVKGGKMLGFDYLACKGCGVCAEVCPVKVIEMVKEER
ncbi:MAG TPA: 4Fe-4S binding protein [Coprothermobacter sp.]|uniref:Pyruvate synthase subunit PorD (Pyruvate oxidoreductasedelta chain) (POR) (Pyruvic-ferredoxin oxidoreductase subunit delta) n=1 Tax=Coprothermobacter proteolyticus (strain ATCC 35245 / DSM 5265 / OCM 4 / BT) TaxID=309798 RepID=B5Y9Q9_COPPD|nr:4Fe-4S binding protein [Coprothermobacter proteolyticus]ACI17165.1 pyruvate ferredoxin oxidoreductase [Coprothermobacter proteolyticus DSM 5265]HHY43962.1 4Fe-4S binding protein [Coprothermobacter sp.]